MVCVDVDEIVALFFNNLHYFTLFYMVDNCLFFVYSVMELIDTAL